MSTLSVPLTPQLESFINSMVTQGKAENKAQVVRQAIAKMEEDEETNEVLLAYREIEEGKGLRGDLREIAKKFKN